MRKVLLLVVAVLALTTTLSGCAKDSEVYTVLLSTPVESLDVAMDSSKSSHQLISDVYSGMAKINGENEQINVNANSITVSEDGLVYNIELNDSFVWVDSSGTAQGPVTANDYVFAYQRMVDPLVGSVYSFIFENIQNAKEILNGELDPSELGVVAIDDYNLEITLVKPTPYFENLLAFGSYVAQPQAAYEQYGENYATSADTMWYSGPYYVTDYDPDYIISLEKNPEYYNADAVEVERIDYRYNSDDMARLNAFTSGEADYAELDSTESYTAAKEEGIVTNQATMFSYYFVLNTSDSSKTSNEDLRQALSRGFDREQIVNSVFEGLNTPIEYIIPSGLTESTYQGLDYRDIAGDKLTSYDKQAAGNYFDKYMGDNDLTDRSQIELDYLVNGESTVDMAFAEVVQAYYLEQFGITINIDNSTGGDYKEKRRDGGFDILYTDWAPDYGDPSTYLALWQTSSIGSQNYAQYSNPEYDKLYIQANLETDPEQRFKLFAKCEKLLIDDAVLVPLYQKNQPYLLNEEYQYPEYVIFLVSHEYLTTTV